MKQRLGDPKQGMVRMDGASSQMILHSVFFSTSIAFLLYFDETLCLTMRFKEVYQILDIYAGKASVKNRLVDWPDAGVYNV